jgi:hypothetical protein
MHDSDLRLPIANSRCGGHHITRTVRMCSSTWLPKKRNVSLQRFDILDTGAGSCCDLETIVVGLTR